MWSVPGMVAGSSGMETGSGQRAYQVICLLVLVALANMTLPSVGTGIHGCVVELLQDAALLHVLSAGTALA
mgnify:CR=1 FL=1